MQFLSVKDDGTTTVELTDQEAHEIRDLLADKSGSTTAWTLHRLLSHAHGDATEVRP